MIKRMVLSVTETRTDGSSYTRKLPVNIDNLRLRLVEGIESAMEDDDLIFGEWDERCDEIAEHAKREGYEGLMDNWADFLADIPGEMELRSVIESYIEMHLELDYCAKCGERFKEGEEKDGTDEPMRDIHVECPTIEDGLTQMAEKAGND